MHAALVTAPGVPSWRATEQAHARKRRATSAGTFATQTSVSGPPMGSARGFELVEAHDTSVCGRIPVNPSAAGDSGAAFWPLTMSIVKSTKRTFGKTQPVGIDLD